MPAASHFALQVRCNLRCSSTAPPAQPRRPLFPPRRRQPPRRRSGAHATSDSAAPRSSASAQATSRPRATGTFPPSRSRRRPGGSVEAAAIGCARPDDTNWTGAKIKSCCRLASLLDVPLLQAAPNVVPVAVTAGDKIESLRQWASGRCLSADRAGVYSRSEAGNGGRVRRVVQEPGVN